VFAEMMALATGIADATFANGATLIASNAAAATIGRRFVIAWSPVLFGGPTLPILILSEKAATPQ
jgi:hypothetical protein